MRLPWPELEAWITSAGKRRDGMVKFYRNADTIKESAVFALSFKDATCVRYRKITRGDETLTTLVLAARGINLMGEGS